jgi:hypothetical protein
LRAQIESAFTEASVILNSIRRDGLVKAAWSLRATVNLEWLKKRTEEGAKAVTDPRVSWVAIINEPVLELEYLNGAQDAAAGMLVLSWRLLLILGEQPIQVDHSRLGIESAVVVDRHAAGLDF